MSVDSTPDGLTLKLYPTNLPIDDTSSYTSTSPLTLSTMAAVFITVGAVGENRQATLNYVASVTWAVTPGALTPVTVTYTIQDTPSGP